MWSYKSEIRSILRVGIVLAGTALLAACANDGGSGATAETAAVETPAPDFATYSDQFVALQSAGLRGDYPGFARALKAADATPLIAELSKSFRGGPFDVYTRNAELGAQDHRRIVELRSTSGRLYLYVEMRKVPGGWVVADHDLSRRSSVILARL